MEKDINKEIKIINSFEQSKRGEEEVLPDDDDYKYEIKRKLKKNSKTKFKQRKQSQ